MKKTLLFLAVCLSQLLQCQNIWTETAVPFSDANKTVRLLSMPDDNTVWVIGKKDQYETTINSYLEWAKSEDAGNTWTNGTLTLGFTNTYFYVTSIHATSASTAYITVSNYWADSVNSGKSGVYVTHDSGATWNKQPTASFSDPTSYPAFVYFWDSNNGVAAGDAVDGYFEIYTTANAGDTWTRVANENIPQVPPQEVEFEGGYIYNDGPNYLNHSVVGNTVWFFNMDVRMLKSDDRGHTWRFCASPFYNEHCDIVSCLTRTLSFTTESNGLAFFSPDLYSTTDGGDSWTPSFETYNIPNAIDGLYVPVPQTTRSFFTYGFDFNYTHPGSSYSTDGGQNWTSLNNLTEDHFAPVNAKFRSATVGYCAAYLKDRITGANILPAKFYRLHDPTARFLQTAAVTDRAFSVSPNPTSGLLKLRGKNINRVSVCDISGKKIIEQQFSNVSEAPLDLSVLQNGIYLAQIYNDSGEMSTVKMIKN